MKEMVGGCCVCSDERGWPDNPLVYCDGNGCTVAVHQACYGIVTVPTGPWYCRKCESPETKGKVKCELCPSKSGALKRTDTGGWAHVVCALYIPEVRFGNVTSMEPIVLRLIPAERYSRTCYICQDLGKTHRANAGACMQCNKSGCKQQFHVTCAQSLGLLCEEAGNYLDNVKYCGYCQHHYSKLKKGGNVKTIPPYKPVVHDGQSSDSSGEKEGEGSPSQGGTTPTHPAKAKGPGRKSSHSSSGTSGKVTPNAAKTPTNTTQPMETNNDTAEPPPTGRRSKAAEKHKKKASPSRRGSSAGEGGTGSKTNTPAPSPQHSINDNNIGHQGKAGGSTPSSAKATPPAASPGGPKPEPVGVISSAPSAPPTSTPINTSNAMSMSMVQSLSSKSSYQDSVITNTDAVDTKQTKKRKAISNAAMAAEYQQAGTSEPPHMHAMWEGNHQISEVQLDNNVDKIVKKAKTEGIDCVQSPAPLPPPAHSPASQPSPRQLPSPMPGPSGMGPVTNMRSPSQPQVSAASEVAGPLPHIYQTQKQAAAESSVASHSPHGSSARPWAGLNVCYEMQQDPNKPGISGVAGPSKDTSIMTPIRNKKRAAMTACAQANKPIRESAFNPYFTEPTATQTLASVRRSHQTSATPMYQETIKESPPSSPSSERPLKPKLENSRMLSSVCTAAPHMLGNELNPASGAAARLQEQLTAELAEHAAGQASNDQLHPPPLHNKMSLFQSITGYPRSSGSAQSLDQLLERQWEQGSHFLMEQAQHFDIASLLSCLHQLRTENVRLEEHVGSLLQRRDHLLAVNARLAIPLNTVSGGSVEPVRCPREPSASRAPPAPVRPAETITSERSHQLMMREVQQKPS